MIKHARVQVCQVRLGRDTYRVLRLGPPPPRAFLFDDMGWTLDMYVDHPALAVLSTAMALATRSKRSLVYLPIRTNPPPTGVTGVREPLDLVLVHHSLQFPASRWPAVRARLGHGRPHVAGPFPEARPPDYDQMWHRKYRDLLRFTIVARTLFVTGGPEAFRRGVFGLLPLDGPAPAEGAHSCVEIDADRRLHIQRNDAWRL